MQKLSARERISQSEPPVVATLEGEKAKRFRARTMLIPSPHQVRDAISEIPVGSTLTLKELQLKLARAAAADVSCPFATRICWQLVAEAAEEDRAEGISPVTPWWRVTKDKHPNPKLPGGSERHCALLGQEGVWIS